MIENIGAYSQVDYDRGYQQGRADKYREITSEYMLLTEQQVSEIRADAIEDFIKEHTSLNFRGEPYIFITNTEYEQLKEQTTETWHGYHYEIKMPKGTFERIFNDCEENNDDV